MRGFCLQAQLTGRAFDLCREITDDELSAEIGYQKIVDAIFKRDPLSVVTETYQTFNDLLNVRRSSNESFRNYESRFSAQVAKFNAHGKSLKFHESLLALMLLSSANLDNAQRVSILAAASRSSNAPISASSSTPDEEYIKQIKYESVSSVLRQCDKDQDGSKESSLTVNSANTYSNKKNKYKHKTRLTPDQLASLKARSQCHTCKAYGHWSTDHRSDGSLKPGIPSNNSPNASGSNSNHSRKESSGSSNTNSKGNTLNFNTAYMSFTSEIAPSNSFYVESQDPIRKPFNGPMVDTGAPYSAIGLTELRILKKIPQHDDEITLDPKPQRCKNYDSWQYGQGSHASAKRSILGSVVLSFKTCLLYTSPSPRDA